VTGNSLIQPGPFGNSAARSLFCLAPACCVVAGCARGYGIYRNTMSSGDRPADGAAAAVFQDPQSAALAGESADPRERIQSHSRQHAQTLPWTRHFRVGYVQSCSSPFSAICRRATGDGDVPGTKGTRLPQEMLPNTFSVGAVTRPIRFTSLERQLHPTCRPRSSYAGGCAADSPRVRSTPGRGRSKRLL